MTVHLMHIALTNQSGLRAVVTMGLWMFLKKGLNVQVENAKNVSHLFVCPVASGKEIKTTHFFCI